MSEPLLDVEIAAYLSAQGFGADQTGKLPSLHMIFVGEEPPKPPIGTSITILEDGGGPSEIQGLVERRAFTLRTQGDEFPVTKALAQQLNRALNNQQGILSNIQVARIVSDTNPIHLGKSDNNKHVFTQSFSVHMKRIVPTEGVDFEPQP